MPLHTWSWMSANRPGEFDVLYGPDVVAGVVWHRPPVEPANTMTAICAGLNADAGSLRADEGDWWWRSTNQGWWFELCHVRVQAGEVVWHRDLRSPAATMNRIIAGLNGHVAGVPADARLEPADPFQPAHHQLHPRRGQPVPNPDRWAS